MNFQQSTVQHSSASPSPRPRLASAASNDDLPEGWEVWKTKDGITFYVDHNTHTTTWDHPRKQARRTGEPPVRLIHIFTCIIDREIFINNFYY